MERPKMQWTAVGLLFHLLFILVNSSAETEVTVPPSNNSSLPSSDILADLIPYLNSTIGNGSSASLPNSEILVNDYLNLTNANLVPYLNVTIGNGSLGLETDIDNSSLLSNGNEEEVLLPNSTSPIVVCDKQEVDTLADNIQKMCSWVSDIDEYVKKVFVRETVSVPPMQDGRGYKDIIIHYNDHVKVFKDHCLPWRNASKSIVDSMKDVVGAVQEFAPKFTNDFDETLKLVEHVVGHHENISDVEKKLTVLQNDIKEAEETLKLTNVSRVVVHLEGMITRKQEEIDSIMKENEVAKARNELEALIHYLESVRNYAAQIEAEAETVRTRISDFKDNTTQDAGILKRHRRNAKEAVMKIEEEKEENNQEIANIQTDKVNLEAKIEGERRQIVQVNGQIQAARNELSALEHSIARSMKKVKRKKKFGRIFRVVVPVVGWIGGTKMVNDAKRRERQLAEEKRNYINAHTRLVQSLNAQIAQSNNEIAHLQNRLQEQRVRQGQLQKELEEFVELDAYLNIVEEEADSVLPFIAKAATSMGQMKDTYDLVKLKLQTVIEEAKEAKRDAEVRNVKFFIYRAIDQLKCEWQEATSKLVLIDQCSLAQ